MYFLNMLYNIITSCIASFTLVFHIYYDILVKIEAPSEKEIERIITKKIRKVKNVNTTTTLSVISEQEDL